MAWSTRLPMDVYALRRKLTALLSEVTEVVAMAQWLSDNGNAQFEAHIADRANPHQTTAAQLGLGNVSNTADADKPVSAAQQAALNAKADAAATTAGLAGKAEAAATTAALATKADAAATTSALAGKASTGALSTHVTDTGNPHGVTKAQVGLGSVDNTSDASKPVSGPQAAALAGKSDVGHQHSAADITSGSLDKARLPVGYPQRFELYSGTSNASGLYNVTFSAAFAATPNVQANVIGADTETLCRVVSRSTTGFSIQVFKRVSLTVLTINLLSFATTNVAGATVDVTVAGN